MENNDLGPSKDWTRRAGVMFEGVLASPPSTPRLRLFKPPPVAPLYQWTLNDLPYRSLRRFDSRMIYYEVYTFLQPGDPDWTDQIEGWLNRMNVFPYATISFASPVAMQQYLAANLEVRSVYVGTPEQAVSMRCTIADPTKELQF